MYFNGLLIISDGFCVEILQHFLIYDHKKGRDRSRALFKLIYLRGFRLLRAFPLIGRQPYRLLYILGWDTLYFILRVYAFDFFIKASFRRSMTFAIWKPSIFSCGWHIRHLIHSIRFLLIGWYVHHHRHAVPCG